MPRLRAAGTPQAESARGRWPQGWPWPRKAPGPGVRQRTGAARAQRPHPSPGPRAVGGETRAREKADNARPGWRAPPVPGSPARRGPPAAALSLLLSLPFPAGAVEPGQLSRGRWSSSTFAAAAAFLPAGRLPRSVARRRASRAGRARRRRARGTRARAKRARHGRGRGRAGELGARRSPRNRRSSGGLSFEAGVAPRFGVRYERRPGPRRLPAILDLPTAPTRKGSWRGPTTSSPAQAGLPAAGIPAPAPELEEKVK